MSSDGTPSTEFSPVEWATIRYAVQDYAAGWYGQVRPFKFGKEQAIRYTAEGAALRELCDRHGLKAVWQAVAAVVEQDPQVLERRLSEAERTEQQQRRAAEALRLADEAAAAFQDGDRDRALALIDQAELADPTHPAGFRSWDELREIIRSRLAA